MEGAQLSPLLGTWMREFLFSARQLGWDRREINTGHFPIT